MDADPSTALAESGEACVFSVQVWDAAALEEWEGDRAAFEVADGGSLLPIVSGALTRHLPGRDFIEKGAGTAVSLEVVCPVPSACSEAAATGVALLAGVTRVELVLLASSERAELVVFTGGVSKVVATKEGAGAPPGAKTILRLELSPDHATVTAFVGTSAFCLRVVGSARIPPATDEQALRCGLVSRGRGAQLGPFAAHVLASDRLCVGGGGFAELFSDAGPAAAPSALPTASSGGNWTFSDDLSAGDRLDIQAMLAVNGLQDWTAGGRGGLTFYSPDPPEAQSRVAAKLQAFVQRVAQGCLENEDQLEELLDELLAKAGAALPPAQSGSSQWTVSAAVSDERRADIMALIGTLGSAPAEDPGGKEGAATVAVPEAGANGWKISASLSAEKHAQLVGLIGAGE
jgi:hypothetical protein